MKEIIKTLEGNTITTFTELKECLSFDSQGSGTLEGYVLVDECKIFIRKHWSYSGGFPFFDSKGEHIGEIVLNDNLYYCEGKYCILYDEKGYCREDAILSVQYLQK